MDDRIVAAVETGGSKVLAAVARVGDGPPALLAEHRVDTGDDAAATLAAVAGFLGAQREPAFGAVGIAAFGPVDIRPRSPRFGRVGATPKPGWRDADLLGGLRPGIGDAPVVIDTDVNAAGYGEWRWGAARGADVALYLTVGTGIGGGVVIHGAPLHGLGHPEMGHIPVPRHPADDAPGRCPHHPGCLEGFAAGPALEGRGGLPARDLPHDHPAWDVEAFYLAEGLAALCLVLAPEVVVLGGGIAEHPDLVPMVHRRLGGILGSYVPVPPVVPPELGPRAGLVGALGLAARHLEMR